MAAVHGKAKLEGDVLEITRHFETGRATERKYRVAQLADHPAIPGPAFALTVLNPDGSIFDGRQYADGGDMNSRPWVYTVARTATGIECDCADWTYRRQNDAEPCKHGKSLQAVGKMPGGKP